MKIFSALLLAMLLATPLAAAPKKILVVSTTLGFRHSSIATGEKVLADLAKTSGAFTVEFLQQPEGKPANPKKDASAEEKAAFKAAETKWIETALKPALQKLSSASLKNYDGVIFLSTTGVLPIPDMDGFIAWIKSGGAFIGIHAASDTFHGNAEFITMLGGEFLKHGPQVSVDCINQDLNHPATKHLGKSWHIAQEEIYEFKNYDPAKVHDLLIYDKHPQTKDPGHFASSWCKPFGQGRVFYAAIGHREDIWDTDPSIKDRKNGPETSQAYQAHLLGGIKWALKLAD